MYDGSASASGMNAALIFDTNTGIASMQPLSNQTAYPAPKFGGNIMLGRLDYVLYLYHI